MSSPGGGQDLEQLVRDHGEDGLLREAEIAGLGPRAGRMRCPFPGCAHKGPKRPLDVQVLRRGGHPRVKCWSCGGGGDLVDLLEATRGVTRAEAVAYMRGQPAPPPKPRLQLVTTEPAKDREERPPEEVRRIWEKFVEQDRAGQDYLNGRGLADATELGLARFATEGHPDSWVTWAVRRGYRVAVQLRDAAGHPRAVQLRRVVPGEPRQMTLKGTTAGAGFFGWPERIDEAALVAVAEGLADTLALASWARGHEAVVVGAAGADNVPKLAQNLAACGVDVRGKLFCLFPQNDGAGDARRPGNKSRMAFTRLAQLLTAAGASVAWVRTPDRYGDVADWLKEEADLSWPPPELGKALHYDPAQDVAPADRMVELPDLAVPVPAQWSVKAFGQDFGTLLALLDDPVHREAIIGRGELSWCEMRSGVRLGERLLVDGDLIAIRGAVQIYAQSIDGRALKFTLEDIGQALHLVSKRRTTHPVRRWLRKIAWNGEDLFAQQLPAAFGYAPDAFAATLLRRWFVAAVARPLRPGCKVDTVLILQGPQAAGKSTFCELIGGEWYTGDRVDIGEKDGKMLMRRSWVIEWQELDALRRARDQEAIKAFITQRVDQFRPPYGREVIEVPRSSIFIGTSNPQEILSDPTGSRRYWPIHVERIDLPWVTAHREQLLAQAVALFDAGEQWWLTPEEDAQLAEQNRAYESSDSWKEPVQDWLQSQPFTDRVSVAQVLDQALGVPLDKQDPGAQRRVATVLQELGWSRERIWEHGSWRRIYRSPTSVG